MLPEGWFDELNRFDAIFFGAVGWPDVVPDHISLWGSLLQFRRHFDQYVNLRPVKLMPGVTSPLAGRQPGEVDFYVVRENTEGEYSSIGGKIFEGTRFRAERRKCPARSRTRDVRQPDRGAKVAHRPRLLTRRNPVD